MTLASSLTYFNVLFSGISFPWMKKSHASGDNNSWLVFFASTKRFLKSSALQQIVRQLIADSFAVLLEKGLRL